MKKSYILLSALAVSVGIYSFQSGNGTEKKMISSYHKDASGKGGAYAGAPGDQNCTQCHTGNTQSGATVNSVTFISGSTPVTEYTPGASYTISLAMSPNPSKKGFQAVAMNSNNQIVGTATGNTIGGTQTKTTNRPTHKSTSNTSSNMVWLWDWTAPATDEGDITFYVASMSANNNGSAGSGDVVYLSQHVFGSSANNGLSDQKKDKYNFSAGYSSDQNAIIMDFNSLIAEDMFLNLVDLSGKSVFTYKMNEAQVGKNHEKVSIPESIKDGIYVVNMFVGNNAMQQKIMIQK